MPRTQRIQNIMNHLNHLAVMKRQISKAQNPGK
ncbi:hypothetical protein Avbf_01974 [Armadillidium vulgare]|nr:hypothetical protein Avbf_01974 [Armadillidium vulgare]